jgi:hypothetical protein
MCFGAISVELFIFLTIAIGIKTIAVDVVGRQNAKVKSVVMARQT